ncbi:hypothetical protein J2S09_000950 [Bacillus fengqiuensis]|nr:hypothetical protein [Bacillus fengqiuensis]
MKNVHAPFILRNCGFIRNEKEIEVKIDSKYNKVIKRFIKLS